MSGQIRLDRDGGRHGVLRTREGGEEGVSLCVHLVTAVRGECPADEGSMALEHRLVPLAEAGQKASGALEVTEHQRDGAPRESLAGVMVHGVSQAAAARAYAARI